MVSWSWALNALYIPKNTQTGDHCALWPLALGKAVTLLVAQYYSQFTFTHPQMKSNSVRGLLGMMGT